MSTPGIGDPYFYEWYVGLEYAIKMLNPDNKIDYVIFQSSEYDTIDDIVVGYENGASEVCYQVKHEIGNKQEKSITFNDILTVNKSESLISAIANGWSNAIKSKSTSITPILYTNKKLGVNKTNRKFKGISYCAYPLSEFIDKIKKAISNNQLSTLEETDLNLYTQWIEFKSAIDLSEEDIIEFTQKIKTEHSNQGLEEKYQSLADLISLEFNCDNGLSKSLLDRLIAQLREWTTSIRKSEKITADIVYEALYIKERIDINQHRLTAPIPFFDSRKQFCEKFIKLLEASNKRIAFLFGNPGCGKTSIVSYLQTKYNFFDIRYHTFKPISPEQHFYNLDEGMCSPRNLWGTLLEELRHIFAGELFKHKIPVANDLCSTAELREHVIRLLSILAEKKEKRIFVCIDGIDHAARTTKNNSYLETLPSPDEISDNICFVIVGQPIELYKDFYPNWISDDSVVQKINIPKLKCNDISALLQTKCNISSDIDKIAKIIHDKTQGNNLSVVYTIEAIKKYNDYSRIVDYINNQAISSDINIYYKHIWDFAIQEIFTKLNLPYIDIVIASCILLMNGRVNSRILSNALNCGLSQADFVQVLDNMYPLLSKNEDEYLLFHNDFRVYLMNKISGYTAKYKETAYKIAVYLNNNDEGIISLCSKIELLLSADKKEEIFDYFNIDYVIDCLANKISLTRIKKYLEISLEVALLKKDINLLQKAYFCSKTLLQNLKYNESIEKEYTSFDYYDVFETDINEVRKLIFNKDNLNEYHRVVELCLSLYKTKNITCIERSNNLYSLWFSDFDIPTAILSLTDDKKNIENDTSISSFFKDLAYYLTISDKEFPIFEIKSIAKESQYIAVSFSDNYFKYCIQNEKYKKAKFVIDNHLVTISAFNDEIFNLAYSKDAILFTDSFSKLSKIADNNEYQIFYKALCVLLTKEKDYKIAEFLIPQNTGLYDRKILSFAAHCFINGFNNSSKSDKDIIKHITKQVINISESDEKKRILERVLSLSYMLGKYHKSNESFTYEFKDYLNWLLTSKDHANYDFYSSYSFILCVLSYFNRKDEMFSNEFLLEDIKYYLININYGNFQIKKVLLNTLLSYNQNKIVYDYFHNYYGDYGEKILSFDDPFESYSIFKEVIEKVDAPFCEMIYKKLSSNVIRYMSYREDILSIPYELYDQISIQEPFCWKDFGNKLNHISTYIDNFSNEYHYELQKINQRNALLCGLDNYKALQLIDDDFKYSESHLKNFLTNLINSSSTIDDLKLAWILACALHSPYTTDSIWEMIRVYEALVNRCNDFDFNIIDTISELTPNWLVIINNYLEDDEFRKSFDYSSSHFSKHSCDDSKLNNLDAEHIITEICRIKYDDYKAISDTNDLINCIIENNYELNCDDKEKTVKHISKILSHQSWCGKEYQNILTMIVNLYGTNFIWITLNEILYSYEINNIDIHDLIVLCNKLHYLCKNYDSKNIIYLKTLLQNEIDLHIQWIQNSEERFCINELPKIENGSSLLHVIYSILLNQLDLYNCRRIESSLCSLFILNSEYGELINIICKEWKSYSNSKKSLLSLLLIRIVRTDKKDYSDLYNLFYQEYLTSSTLKEKFYLYTLLMEINPKIAIIDELYKAELNEIDLAEPPTDYRPRIAEPYLEFLKQYVPTLKLSYYLEGLSKSEAKNSQKYSQVGDLFISSISQSYYKALYDCDKNGEFDSIPLNLKIQSLIDIDDPYLITTLPTIDFGLKKYFESINNDEEKTIEYINKIIDYNINHENEYVLAAEIWIPKRYEKISKNIYYSSLTSIEVDCKLTSTNNNYGVFNIKNLDKTSYVDLLGFAINLFNYNIGSKFLPTSSCLLTPSKAWEDVLECSISSQNPHNIIDCNGNEIMRFERILCPYQDNRNIAYCKQPMVFRWICSEEWLEQTLYKKGLMLYPNSFCTEGRI